MNYICLELLREKFLPRELLLIEATTTHCMRDCWRNIHAITNCMKTVKTGLTRRLHSNLFKKACFSLTCDLLLCAGERLFSTSLKAIESIFKVGIVGLRGLSLYFKFCMIIEETLTLL